MELYFHTQLAHRLCPWHNFAFIVLCIVLSAVNECFLDVLNSLNLEHRKRKTAICALEANEVLPTGQEKNTAVNSDSFRLGTIFRFCYQYMAYKVDDEVCRKENIPDEQLPPLKIWCCINRSWLCLALLSTTC